MFNCVIFLMINVWLRKLVDGLVSKPTVCYTKLCLPVTVAAKHNRSNSLKVVIVSFWLPDTKSDEQRTHWALSLRHTQQLFWILIGILHHFNCQMGCNPVINFLQLRQLNSQTLSKKKIHLVRPHCIFFFFFFGGGGPSSYVSHLGNVNNSYSPCAVCLLTNFVLSCITDQFMKCPSYQEKENK